VRLTLGSPGLTWVNAGRGEPILSPTGPTWAANTAPHAHNETAILRLRMNQFEGRDTSGFDDAIKAYLTFAKRPTSELAANKYYAHIEPFRDPEIPQTSFHIALNMKKGMLEGSNLQNLPRDLPHPS
jgi:hypothetical protein